MLGGSKKRGKGGERRGEREREKEEKRVEERGRKKRGGRTMTSADLWLRTAAIAVPVRRALHILGQHVPQEVYIVKIILFRLDLSLLDTFPALVAIL
jgi:hypothetical protein